MILSPSLLLSLSDIYSCFHILFMYNEKSQERGVKYHKLSGSISAIIRPEQRSLFIGWLTTTCKDVTGS